MSPTLGAVKQEQIKAKCTECGVEIERDGLLYMDAGQPLCLACVKMDDLDHGARAEAGGDRLHAARPASIERAEQECAEDAGERAEARRHAAEARVREYAVFTEQMVERIRELFPGCPLGEAGRIASHTAQRGSGRVGRSAAGRALKEDAVVLAVAAWVRHRHTDYDSLLISGMLREDARRRVREKVDEILDPWR